MKVIQVGDMAGVGYKVHQLLLGHDFAPRLLVCAPETRFSVMSAADGVTEIPYKSRRSNFRLLAKLIRSRGTADVYHAHSLMSILLMCSARPYVAHFHGSDVHEVASSDTRLGQLLRLAMRRAAHVLHCTHDLAPPIVAAGVAPENMTWLPNPIDTDRFSRTAPTKDLFPHAGLTILHPQPVRKERRNGLFFEAFVRVARQNPDTKLLWFQHERSGTDHAYYVDYLRQAGVLDQVHQMPRVEPAQMSEYLSAADVVVDWFNRDLPAVSQTCMEALACERTVIAGLPVDKTHYLHDSGVLAGGTVDEIEGSLRLLINEPHGQQERGRKGRAWVQHHHGFDAVREKLRIVYSRALQSGVSGASK